MKSKKSDSSSPSIEVSHTGSELFTATMSVDNLGISIRDRELNLTYQNPLLIDQFGSRLGEKCHEVFNKTKKQCPNCPVVLTLQDGRPHSTIREVALSSGGRIV